MREGKARGARRGRAASRGRTGPRKRGRREKKRGRNRRQDRPVRGSRHPRRVKQNSADQRTRAQETPLERNRPTGTSVCAFLSLSQNWIPHPFRFYKTAKKTRVFFVLFLPTKYGGTYRKFFHTHPLFYKTQNILFFCCQSK